MNERAQLVGLAELPFADVSVHPGVQRLPYRRDLVLVGYIGRRHGLIAAGRR